ncbi:MAG: P-loop NTPase, partial [Alphaproteobacteria bacterium]
MFRAKKEVCVSQEDLLRVLRDIPDERSGRTNIVDSGMVSSVRIDESGHAVIILSVSPEEGAKLEGLRQKVERVIAGVTGISKVSAILTATVSSQDKASDCARTVKRPKEGGALIDVPARHIIAVASGKGGVGKSTVSANLAVALAHQKGLRVGLLDADIYGPSQPLMMGSKTYKPSLDWDEKLVPAQVHGISLMSIGFMVDPEQALIWRGPMVQSAFCQMAGDVAWAGDGGKLDVLVIDLPPGTGDVQLTMVQKLHMSGAVIVSTPQDVALIDARRAAAMFEKTGVPVLGMIENMSTYVCPQCGHEDHIFGHGGVRAQAEKIGIPYLGDIPLTRLVREKSDRGEPLVLSDSGDIAVQRVCDISTHLEQ